MSDAESPLAKLLGLLEVEDCNPRRGRGEQWIAKCPAHDDRVASLSLSQGDDGRALVHCQAGCQPEDVLRALGLVLRDLFVPATAEQVKTPHRHPERRPPAKAEPPLAEDRRFGAVPPAMIRHGCPVCVHAYAFLAWRCGRANRAQHGVGELAREIGVQSRTVGTHLLHLAERGWIFYRAAVTTTGARRAIELSLRHCAALGIVNPDAVLPSASSIRTPCCRIGRTVSLVGRSRVQRATPRLRHAQTPPSRRT